MKRYLWAVLAVCVIGCGGEAVDGDRPAEESSTVEEASESSDVSTEPEATEGDITRSAQACTVIRGVCTSCGWTQYKRCCTWNGRGYHCYEGWYCMYNLCTKN